MSDVFLSYEPDDRRVAGRIAAALEQSGYQVCWRRPQGARELRAWVARELPGARAVVIVWSPRSRNSRFVLDEATLAGEAKLSVALDRGDLPKGVGAVHVRLPGRWSHFLRAAPFGAIVDAVREKLMETERPESFTHAKRFSAARFVASSWLRLPVAATACAVLLLALSVWALQAETVFADRSERFRRVDSAALEERIPLMEEILTEYAELLLKVRAANLEFGLVLSVGDLAPPARPMGDGDLPAPGRNGAVQARFYANSELIREVRRSLRRLDGRLQRAGAHPDPLRVQAVQDLRGEAARIGAAISALSAPLPNP